MEKLKVSREVAEAIDDLRSRRTETYSNEEILRMHYGAVVLGEEWSGSLWKHLNDIPTMECMARILLIGYEIEETPQEHLARLFNNEWSVAKKEAVRCALDILNIKVSGVNDR